MSSTAAENQNTSKSRAARVQWSRYPSAQRYLASKLSEYQVLTPSLRADFFESASTCILTDHNGNGLLKLPAGDVRKVCTSFRRALPVLHLTRTPQAVANWFKNHFHSAEKDTSVSAGTILAKRLTARKAAASRMWATAHPAEVQAHLKAHGADSSVGARSHASAVLFAALPEEEQEEWKREADRPETHVDDCFESVRCGSSSNPLLNSFPLTAISREQWPASPVS